MANQITSLPMGQKFKKTLAGSIPMDWDARDIQSLTKAMINGGTPDTKNEKLWNGNIPWITGADFANQNVATVRRYISSEAIQNSSTNLVPKGAVLVVTRTGVGKLAITDRDIAISQDITGIIPDTNAILPEFLFWQLNLFAPQLKAAHQGTSISGILRSDLESLTIPLPPLVEQRKIAAILSAVDAVIEKTTAVVIKTKELRNGLVRLIFNSETGHGQSRPSRRIVNLRLLCELITKGTTPTTYGFKYTDSGVRFIKIENIGKNGHILPSGITYISEETHQALRRSILRKDDILFSIAGALGRSSVVTEDILPANTNQAVAIIRLNREKADPCYVRYFLDSDAIRRRIENIGTQGAQINLSLAQVGDMPIPLPPLAEQRRIAGVIATLDNQIFREMRFGQNLERTKLALMRVLLMGKVRAV